MKSKKPLQVRSLSRAELDVGAGAYPRVMGPIVCPAADCGREVVEVDFGGGGFWFCYVHGDITWL